MEEQTIYPVCPHRNVAEAFDCFLGPDSRQLDRFLEDQRAYRARTVLRLLRVQGRRAYAGAALGMREVASVIPKAITDLNLILTLGWITAWISATWVFAAFVWAWKILLYNARVWLPRGRYSASAAAAVLGRRVAQLRRTEDRYAANPQRLLI
jgi:hypothetical protein